MIYLDAVLSQQFTPAALTADVRAALGQPLRRAAAFTRLAAVGALRCLPAERRGRPTALLWQTTSGPRPETLALLAEVCGAGEPMPYDFLAAQPAITAAQLQPFLPGLQSASHFPQDSAGAAQWSLLVGLAAHWLDQGRYAQVLCAHLDHWDESLTGHWLALSGEASAAALAGVSPAAVGSPDARPDTPDFPAQLAAWLARPSAPPLALQSPATPRLAVEFARLQSSGPDHVPVLL